MPVLCQIPVDENLETIIICAERYAIGRRTYMPSIVTEFIIPLLPSISNKTLSILRNDIKSTPDLGDKTIDEPHWFKLLSAIELELEKRNKR